nr:head-tail connector protein [uncultured Allomuricauda sp.]
MSYLTVIPLANAKTYLGVDDTSRDTEITRMIEAALSLIEKRTNYIMVVGNKDYFYENGCVRVYDYPINTADDTLDDSVTRTQKQLYSIYEDSDTSNDKITLNVGGTTIPSDLKEAGYMLIEFYFNNKEQIGGKLPIAVEQIINNNKRFII